MRWQQVKLILSSVRPLSSLQWLKVLLRSLILMMSVGSYSARTPAPSCKKICHWLGYYFPESVRPLTTLTRARAHTHTPLNLVFTKPLIPESSSSCALSACRALVHVWGTCHHDLFNQGVDVSMTETWSGFKYDGGWWGAGGVGVGEGVYLTFPSASLCLNISLCFSILRSLWLGLVSIR